MPPVALLTPQAIADAARESMRKYDIPCTPPNYAIWYEYHAGQSPNLKRTIDVIISNSAGFDEATLQDLHSVFFSFAKEEQVVRETSLKVLDALQDILDVADSARADARHFGAQLDDFASSGRLPNFENLKELIESLVTESKKMARKSEYVGLRIRESSEKIQALEHNLEAAIRDASQDSLTGVANRKSFDTTIRTLAGDAMNSGDDLSLLMIDIDHFKKVNDTWGHQTGDQVLRHLAQTLQKAMRGGDHVARYGGEEFAAILPRTEISAAVSVAQNIRTALAREPLVLKVDPPFTPVTVSIGVACYEPGESLTEWVERADAALYRAKDGGRNRVESE